MIWITNIDYPKWKDDYVLIQLHKLAFIYSSTKRKLMHKTKDIATTPATETYEKCTENEAHGSKHMTYELHLPAQKAINYTYWSHILREN